MTFFNPDRYLAHCEDAHARAAERTAADEDALATQPDEHGRPPSHPDHGYRGESLSACPACKWTGDPLGSEFCPLCRETLEVES